MNEHNQDDLDVEIIDIDTEEKTIHRMMPARSSLAPPVSRQQRLLQRRIMVGVGVIALCILLLPSDSLRSLTTQIRTSLFFRPTSTGIADGNLFYIDASPVWGRLLIDGEPVAHVPLVDTNQPIALGRGQHVLVWQVRPFQPQSCIASVPRDASKDTCPVHQLSSDSNERSDPWVITFSASLQQLSNTQRTVLVQAMQSSLNAQQSRETLQPGERYVLSNQGNHLVSATQTLRATLHFDLDTDITSNAFCINSLDPGHAASCKQGPQDCRLLCGMPNQEPISSAASPFFDTQELYTSVWNVFGIVRSSWDYATLDGHRIARNQPDMIDSVVGAEHWMQFFISWDGANWHVRSGFMWNRQLPGIYDPTCFPALDGFQIYGTIDLNVAVGTSFITRYRTSPLHALGCLVEITTTRDTPVASNTAYVLLRFGVFIAVNPTAHTLWPALPVSNEHEREVARQLAPDYLG